MTVFERNVRVLTMSDGEAFRVHARLIHAPRSRDTYVHFFVVEEDNPTVRLLAIHYVERLLVEQPDVHDARVLRSQQGTWHFSFVADRCLVFQDMPEEAVRRMLEELLGKGAVTDVPTCF